MVNTRKSVVGSKELDGLNDHAEQRFLKVIGEEESLPLAVQRGVWHRPDGELGDFIRNVEIVVCSKAVDMDLNVMVLQNE